VCCASAFCWVVGQCSNISPNCLLLAIVLAFVRFPLLIIVLIAIVVVFVFFCYSDYCTIFIFDFNCLCLFVCISHIYLSSPINPFKSAAKPKNSWQHIKCNPVLRVL